MADEKDNDSVIAALLVRLKESGEHAFNQFSQQLLENPTFLAALRRSLEAKERVDKTISGTMDFVNLPSKNDVTAITASLEQITIRLAGQQRSVAAIEKKIDELKAAIESLKK